MKKTILLFSVVLVLSSTYKISAQNDSTLSKSRHQISIETGYRNVFSVIDRSVNPFVNQATHGYGAVIDYGWKVSGLNGKKTCRLFNCASWI